MDLGLNDAQLKVLRWVASGADLDNPPIETYKTSAPALKSRGLVTLDKRRGHWSIGITEAGKFYLEHGRHPDAKPPKPERVAPAPSAEPSTPPEPEPELIDVEKPPPAKKPRRSSAKAQGA